MTKILSFFNIVDRNGRLSLTNLALIIVLVKIIFSPFDFSGAAILLPVLASYMQKRYENNKIESTKIRYESEERTNVEYAISQIKSDISDLIISNNFNSEAVKDLKEESVKNKEILVNAQKIVSSSNLAQAFPTFKRRGE